MPADAGRVVDAGQRKVGAPDAGEPVLRPGWVDAPMGLRLRATPDASGAVLGVLEDESPLDVLELGPAPPDGGASGAGAGGGEARWLRVRRGPDTGWVWGEFVARAKVKVSVKGELMLRSIYNTWSGMEGRDEFWAYLKRDGQWVPYEEVMGQRIPWVTDFDAQAELHDLDDDGDTDIAYSSYCCERGTLTLVFSEAGGALVRGPKLEGCEVGLGGSAPGECLGTPRFVAWGKCGETFAIVGPRLYVYSCERGDFDHVDGDWVEGQAHTGIFRDSKSGEMLYVFEDHVRYWANANSRAQELKVVRTSGAGLTVQFKASAKKYELEWVPSGIACTNPDGTVQQFHGPL